MTDVAVPPKLGSIKSAVHTSHFRKLFTSHTIKIVSLDITTPHKASGALLAHKTCFGSTRNCVAAAPEHPLASCRAFVSLEVTRSSKATMTVLTGKTRFTGLWLV